MQNIPERATASAAPQGTRVNRRRFLAALAAIPFLRRLAPKPALTMSEYLKTHYSPEFVTILPGAIIRTPWIKFQT
jgi:hypothetical protein